MGKAVEAKECVGEGGIGGSPCRLWVDEDAGVAMTGGGQRKGTVTAAGSNANASKKYQTKVKRKGFWDEQVTIAGSIKRLFGGSSGPRHITLSAKTYARTGSLIHVRYSSSQSYATLALYRAARSPRLFLSSFSVL